MMSSVAGTTSFSFAVARSRNSNCPDQEIEAGLYLKSAYYLEPEPVGVKPYALLRSALEQTDKVAIGKIALRDREHLCRLAIHEQGILLNTLHWPDEIRSTGELSIPEGDAGVHKRSRVFWNSV